MLLIIYHYYYYRYYYNMLQRHTLQHVYYTLQIVEASLATR